MQHAIATVSLSGTLREKLEAIAAAEFEGVGIFEKACLRHNAAAASAAGARHLPGLAVA